MGKYSGLVEKVKPADKISNKLKKQDYSFRVEEISNGLLVRESWRELRAKDKNAKTDRNEVYEGYEYKEKATYYKTLEEVNAVIK